MTFADGADRVLILCCEPDRGTIELARPKLELEGVSVDVASVLHDVRVARAAVVRETGPLVVAVVVSASLDRELARCFVDAVSTSLGAGQRLLVLDVRRKTSVASQCRTLAGALEGLRRTRAIDRVTCGGLTASASQSATASGIAAGSGTDTALAVVEAPVLLAWPLHTMAEVVPATVRIPVYRGSRSPRQDAATRPELDASGLLDSWASAI